MDSSAKPTGLLTLDVEDWHHANFSQLDGHGSAIADTVKQRAYRMDAATDRWIELLGQNPSTCFVLGEFAEKYPEAVKKLHAAGHEIGSHSYSHDLIYRMTREQFREALARSLGVLGGLTGEAPRGFRAPSWSVDGRTPWHCEELENAGIQYDSSEFPVRTPLFGVKGAPLKPYRVGKIWRVPVTVLTFMGVRLPFASGAFFRLWPGEVIRRGLRRAARRGEPAMVVLHPRELLPDHPRLPLRGWENWVHYQGLQSTEPKLRTLLPEFEWKTVGRFVSEI